MKKARISVTHIFEFDIIPEHYGACDSDLKRLSMDIDNFSKTDLLVDAISTGNSLVGTRVTGELIGAGA